MDYSESATSVKKTNENLEGFVSTIKGIDFSSSWSGPAYETLTTSLDEAVAALEVEKTNLETFKTALDDYERYIKITEKIKKIKNDISMYQTSEENTEQENNFIIYKRTILESDLTYYENEAKILREKIINAISSIGVTNSTQNTIISPGTGADGYTWEELIDKMQTYNSLPVTNNLYTALTLTDSNGNVIRDGEEYFNNVIANIRDQHTGTDKTYFTTIALVDLCLEAGVRLEYEHAGTSTGGVVSHDVRDRVPVPSFNVATGSDCNAVSSFLVFNNDSDVAWLATQEFHSDTLNHLNVSGENTPRGSVWTTEGHTAVVLAYNPETDQYILYNATGTKMDHQLKLGQMNSDVKIRAINPDTLKYGDIYPQYHT